MSSGSLSLSLENLRTLLADCPSARTWLNPVGTDPSRQSAGVSARTYTRGLPPPADHMRYTLAEWATLRPFMILALPDRDPYKAVRVSHYGWGDTGHIEIYVETAIADADADDPAAAQAKLTDILGNLIADMQSLAGLSGYLNLQEIVLSLRPTRCTEKDRGSEGDHFFSVITVAWDGGAGGAS